MTGSIKHRGWTIDYDPKPVPDRSWDWTAAAPDFDVDFQDGRWVTSGGHVNAATYDDLIAQIDAYELERDDNAKV